MFVRVHLCILNYIIIYCTYFNPFTSDNYCAILLCFQGKSGLTRLRFVGSAGANKNHQSLILQQAGVPKKKTSSTSNNIPEFCNDVDLVRKVHDEVLVHAVRDMLHPLLAVKSIPLGDWETDLTPVHSMHAPPAFAKLHGPGGFGKN